MTTGSHLKIRSMGATALGVTLEGNPKKVDARLDIKDKATSQIDVGDFDNPNLYHAAFRVARK